MASGVQFSNPPPTMALPNLTVPPPTATNLSAPPPNLTMINPTTSYQPRFPNHRDANRSFFKFRPYHPPKMMSGGDLEALQDEFDGKRLRKSVMRKTVDYNSSIIKALENRTWQRDFRDRRALQPDVLYYPDLLPPPSYVDNPINAVTTRFVKTATNKMRCPIFCMAWTPEGRRLVTGASSGEFTLWNGLTFNFETILQAHESPVRTMVWSHNESWMVTGDHGGYVKYWQSNMNNVKMFQAHKEAVRGLSFSPTDNKLVTCSDDGTVRIWDFLRCYEERILRGHGADVKCVHWHPQKSLIISGSKDNQQPLKLWDPKTGSSITTLHAHKSTVMDVKWNENGNWLVTASRDHLLKLFDLRNLSQEVQTFRGHKKEASSVAWHPQHEGLFCSGGSDGAILFWHVGADKEVGAIEQAHDSIVWTLAWHPLGHILCSGSNDHTSKFWTRNRPGDSMRDKYNLNTLPAGAGGVDDHEVADEAAIIPGMGPEDRINTDNDMEAKNGEIPGLDLDPNSEDIKKAASKKVPYSKPIPRNFQAQWNEMEGEDAEQVEALNAIVNQLIETTPGAVPLNDVTPDAIILYGKMIPVEPGSKLAEAVTKGAEAINNLVLAGEIEELKDVVKGFTNEEEEEDDTEDYLHDDSDIDYTKVPQVDLPAPLASSKFAQNPELLNALNFGGKRKFDQLIGWSNQQELEKASKSNQPAFSGSFAEESQSSDTDMRYSTGTVNTFNTYDDKSLDLEDQDFRFNSGGSERFSESHGVSRNNFEDTDYRQMNSTYASAGGYGDRDYNNEQSWDDDNRKENNKYSQDNYNKRDELGESGNNSPYNHFKMQNINTNIPPPNLSKPPPLSGKHGPPRMDVPPPHMMSHHNMPPPPFRPNGPPPPIPGNFRGPPPNPNFNPNMPFRPGMTPFVNTFNSFPGPPPFRPPNPNFERNNFGGNYKGQNKSGPQGRMFRPRNNR